MTNTNETTTVQTQSQEQQFTDEYLNDMADWLASQDLGFSFS